MAASHADTSVRIDPAPKELLPRCCPRRRCSCAAVGLALVAGVVGAVAGEFAPLAHLPRGTPVVLAGRPQFMRADLTNAVAVDANARYWMALRADGTVVRTGGLADDSFTSTLSNIVAVSAGGAHSLALRDDGKLFAWIAEGNVFQGEILPIPAALKAASKIAAGYTHSVVLDTEGRLFAWGANTHGAFDPPAWATNVLGITAGQLYSGVILADGRVRGWDLGWPPVGDAPAGHAPAIQVDASVFGHALAVRADGRVFAWGNSSHGQTSVPAAALADVVRVAAGGLHSVALKRDGTAVSWGDNEAGQRNIPADMKFLDIAAGNYSTLGLTRAPIIGDQTSPNQAGAGEDVTVQVTVASSDPYQAYWLASGNLLGVTSGPELLMTNVQPSTGPWLRVVVSNEFGWTDHEWVQLWVNDSMPRVTHQPQDMAILPGAAARFEVQARGSEPFSWQWQFGGRDIPGATSPVLELPAATAEASGAYRVVVSNAIGSIVSEPAFLSVGLPVLAEQPLGLYQRPGLPTRLAARVVSPVPVALQWWKEGAMLAGETTGRLELGAAKAAVEGLYRLTVSNQFGALTSRTVHVRLYDPPTVLTRPALPVLVGQPVLSEKAIPAGLTNALAVVGGDAHGLALREDGRLVGWGKPSGGGDWNPADIPADMGAVAAIAAGRDHNVALRTDGTVRTWGATYGQPTDLGEVVAVSGGSYGFTMALKRDGTAVQWPDPTNVPDGLTNVIAVACGTGSSVILQADGTVIDWVHQSEPKYLRPHRQRFQDPQAIAVAISEWGRWCLLDSGQVLAWNNSDAPAQPISGVTNAVALSSDTTWGGAFCLLADGRVYSEGWGLLGGLEAVGAISGAQHSLFALTRAPYADIPPSGTNIAPGGRLVLAVAARSSTPMTYQWEREGVALAGATGPEFVVESVSAFDRGDYRVRLANADHSLLTAPARVWVTGPVEFRPWPDQAVAAGSDVTASPAWAGEAPVTFQWERDGVALPLATSATLELGNVQAGDAGVYRLRAVNLYGESVSPGFALVVQPSAPRLVTEPVAQSAPAGSEVRFAVQARGTEPFTWQWFFNDQPIGGATNVTLTLRNVQTAQAGIYAVQVDNRVGQARSSGVALTVEPSPPLPIAGADGAVRLALEGNSATIDAGFLGTEPMTWQWRREGVDLEGATERVLSVTGVSATNAGAYTLVARNALGAAESPPIQLIVIPVAGDGTVVGWGSLVPPPGLSDVVAMDGGFSFAVALKRDGTVVRFGRTSDAMLTPPADLTDVVRIATGTGHACALRGDGRVATWGFPIAAVTEVPADLGPVVDVAAGGAFCIALRRDGTVRGWGLESESWGALPFRPPPEATNVVAIAAARDTAVALRRDGSTVWMGRSPSAVRAVPLAATNLVAIDVGAAHAVALREDGKVLVWGSGNAIRPIPAVTNVVGLAAGYTHSLLLSSNGLVAAFGDRANLKTNVPVTLSNVVAVAAGSEFSLAVTRTPMVLTNPAPLIVVEGMPAEWSVVAVGPGPLRFQWSRGGVDLPDQTNATLRLAVVRVGDAGEYRVRAMNPWGVATSAAARLTVLALPFIAQEPTDALIPAGTNLTLTVGIGGAAPLTVQWRFAGVAIEGARNLALTLTNVQAAGAGGYDVVVSSPYGAVTSRVAQVTVVPSGPGFIAMPQSATVPAGLPTRFKAAVYGSEPVTFIWRRGAVEVARTATPEWLVSDPQAADAGAYTVTALNALGQATSRAFVLEVTPSAPRLVRQPADTIGLIGEAAELTVECQGTRPIALQWYRDNAVVPGGAGAALRFEALRPADQARYHCVAANALGETATRIALLEVDPPTILEDLVDRTVAEGDDVSFWVRASGSEPRTFVWTRDGEAVSGGEQGRLNLHAVAQSDAGDYRVAVSNATGVVWSRIARLTVNEAAVRLARSPAALTVLERSLALLNVDARGTPPLTYRWFRDGVALPQATKSWLLFRRSQPADAGRYSVEVSNRLGTERSEPVALTVLPAPPGVAVSWGPADWARPAVTDVVQFGWGWTHGALLRADGTAMGWGYNDPAYHQDQVPPGLGGLVELAVGHVHSIALTSGGELVGWGGGLDGQLTPPPLPVASPWASVVAAGFHSAGVLESGHAIAFGGPEYARAGSPPDGTNVVAVALGDAHLVGLGRDGGVAVWDIGGTKRLPAPEGLAPVVEIAAGEDRVVVRHADGSVSSWAASSGAVLDVPEAATNVVKLAAHERFVVARNADGAVLAWGDGDVPQPVPLAMSPAGVFAGYGRGGLISSLVIEQPPASADVAVGDPAHLHVTAAAVLPVRYQWLHEGMPVEGATNAWFGLPGVTQDDAGMYAVRVQTDDAILESASARIEVRPRLHGAVVGWGNLASPILTQLANVPPRVRALAGGTDHAVALLEDGSAIAWGDPGHGGTAVPDGLRNVVEIAAGYSHYLALHRDGQVTSWGAGDFGQHVAPPGLSDVIHVAAGSLHSVAIRRDGTPVSWGYDGYGQASPPPLRGLVAAAGASDRSAVLHGNGTLSEWGQYHGERPLLLDLVRIAGNGNHFGAISSDGRVLIWAEAVVEYPMLEPAAALAIGSDSGSPHYVVLDRDTARVKCAGRNDFGQATPPSWLQNVIAVGATAQASLAVTTLSLEAHTVDAAGLAGQSLILGVVAVGATPLDYTWRKDGEVVPGAHGPQLVLSAARPEDSGLYTVRVANAFAELTSPEIVVCVLPAETPLLTWLPLGGVGADVFAAAVRVEPGRTYEIQESKDLILWERLRLIPATEPVLLLREAIVPEAPVRFYRLARQ